MKEKVKKYIGEIIVIAGSGIFSYNIFNFSYRTFWTSHRNDLLSEEFGGIAYYYSSNSLILISIGVMLIVGGILIIRNKNHEREN